MFQLLFSSSVKEIIEVLVLISLNHRALFKTIIFTVFTLPAYNHGRFSISQCFCQCFHCNLSSWLSLFVAPSPSYCEWYFYLISFLESLLLVYRKATDFYMLIFVSYNLLKVLIISEEGRENENEFKCVIQGLLNIGSCCLQLDTLTSFFLSDLYPFSSFCRSQVLQLSLPSQKPGHLTPPFNSLQKEMTSHCNDGWITQISEVKQLCNCKINLQFYLVRISHCFLKTDKTRKSPLFWGYSEENRRTHLFFQGSQPLIHGGYPS